MQKEKVTIGYSKCCGKPRVIKAGSSTQITMDLESRGYLVATTSMEKAKLIFADLPKDFDSIIDAKESYRSRLPKPPPKIDWRGYKAYFLLVKLGYCKPVTSDPSKWRVCLRGKEVGVFDNEADGRAAFQERLYKLWERLQRGIRC